MKSGSIDDRILGPRGLYALPEDEFATQVADARRWFPNGASGPEIQAHCAESIAQSLAADGMSPAPSLKRKIRRNLFFYNAVAGHLAHLAGGNECCTYASFRTEEGNQVDRYLAALGYSLP